MLQSCVMLAAGGNAGSLEDGWTTEQVAALEDAYFRTVDPLVNNHWQVVAQQVPGKSAAQCFDKIFEKHPTPPVQKGRQARGAAAKPLSAATSKPVAALTTKTGEFWR